MIYSVVQTVQVAHQVQAVKIVVEVAIEIVEEIGIVADMIADGIEIEIVIEGAIDANVNVNAMEIKTEDVKKNARTGLELVAHTIKL